MDFAMSKVLRCPASRGESRSVTHVNVSSPLRENVAEKFSDVRKNIFQSDTMALSLYKGKKKIRFARMNQVVTHKLSSNVRFAIFRKKLFIYIYI